MKGSFQETAPRKTAENTVKHRDGSVGSVVAKHRSGGESLVVVTTLLQILMPFLLMLKWLHILKFIHQHQYVHWVVGWLVVRLTSPFSTKIGYIRDKVFGGDLVPPGYGWPMIQ